jgi:hypothetical protein
MYKIASVLSYLVFNFSPLKKSPNSGFWCVKLQKNAQFLHTTKAQNAPMGNEKSCSTMS